MPSDVAAEVLRILNEHVRPPRSDELRDDLDLGAAGFGLDSIALVELLLACEEHFGCPFPSTLFEEGPITIGKLAAHAERGSRRMMAP